MPCARAARSWLVAPQNLTRPVPHQACVSLVCPPIVTAPAGCVQELSQIRFISPSWVLPPLSALIARPVSPKPIARRLRAGARPDAVHPARLVALCQVHNSQLFSVLLVALSSLSYPLAFWWR